MRRKQTIIAPSVLAWLLAIGAPAGRAAAQAYVGDGGNDVLFRDRVIPTAPQLDAPLVGAERYVVVHLAENRVYVFEGDEAIWSAPAGTGTGFQLSNGDHQWKFSTPRGMMRVRRMEKDPLWEASDWHYVEKGLKPPPQNDPSRTMSGIMGSTAIYLGDGIAIHGTNQPQLLMNPDPDKRRVSHGCIRLTNENARELMHMIDVGTPVLIY
jgi:lipoprotein-anchoring transpeptidase ErfK/SrfK